MTAVCDQFMYIASDDVKEPVRLSSNTELTYSPRPSKRGPSGLTRADRPGRCSRDAREINTIFIYLVEI